MAKSAVSVYGVALHVFVIALGAATLLLALKNQELRRGNAGAGPETVLVAGATLEGFEVLDLEGRPQELRLAQASSESRDHLLFFFTTTCAVCDETQPRWKALFESLAGGAEVIALSFDPLEATRAYRELMDFPFPVLVIADPNAFVEKYALDAVPFTLQIAADGEIRDSWLGALSEADVTRILSSLPAVDPGLYYNVPSFHGGKESDEESWTARIYLGHGRSDDIRSSHPNEPAGGGAVRSDLPEHHMSHQPQWLDSGWVLSVFPRALAVSLRLPAIQEAESRLEVRQPMRSRYL